MTVSDNIAITPSSVQCSHYCGRLQAKCLSAMPPGVHSQRLASALSSRGAEDHQSHTVKPCNISGIATALFCFCVQGNDLVAEVFYNTSEHPLVDAINFNSYRVRAAAQTMGLHMGPSRSHATIIAFSSSADQQPAQQQWQSLRQQVSCDTVTVTRQFEPWDAFWAPKSSSWIAAALTGHYSLLRLNDNILLLALSAWLLFGKLPVAAKALSSAPCLGLAQGCVHV